MQPVLRDKQRTKNKKVIRRTADEILDCERHCVGFPFTCLRCINEIRKDSV